MRIRSSGPSRRRQAAFISALTLLVVPAVAGGAYAGSRARASKAGSSPSAAHAAVPQIVPKPAVLHVGDQSFALTSRTRIAVRGGAKARAVAQDLAHYLRPATGYRLAVVAGSGERGDISLSVAPKDAVKSDPDGEGYRLLVTAAGVQLGASTAHGLYNGVQTIRQLLPVWINSRLRVPGPWTMRSVQIVDYPRYAYRGVMLDIGRHYEPPAAVERLIDQASAYKINVFHLHLSDDQGFRIVIKGFPNLTRIGGQGSVGPNGQTLDPGGFWTQAQYRAVVAYAQAHFMTLIPEVDSPGHANAIVASEFGDTANPLLNGHPQDIDCGTNNPPVWNYFTGPGVLCPESQNTWRIMTAIIDQLSAMTPGRYYDLGGDEVWTTLLSQSRYASFINKEAGIVRAAGKTVMGWGETTGPGTNLTAPSVAEYWSPASGTENGTQTATDAVAKGMKIVMAPANHAYLSQQYVAGRAGNIPAAFGNSWACGNGCDVDQFYNWDPGSYVTGVTDSNVIGVEGAMWVLAGPVPNLSDVDYMVFPRLLALAEVGWSPKVERTSKQSPAYQDFVGRLAAQGARLQATGVNFYPTPEVCWRLDLSPSLGTRHNGNIKGTLATLAAPGRPTSAINATISWGDGTTTSGTVTGTAATPTTVNGMYRVVGGHHYARAGTYDATVTVTAAGASPASAAFSVQVPRRGH